MRFFNLTRSFEAIFVSGIGLGLVTTVLSFLQLSDGVVWAVALAWAVWSLALVSWLTAMLFGGAVGGALVRVRALPVRALPLRGRRRDDA